MTPGDRVEEGRDCPVCSGKGTVNTGCSLCGDSTYDHWCNDRDVPCSACNGTGVGAFAEVAALRTRLAEVEAERDAAQKQVETLLKAKHDAERIRGNVEHEMAGLCAVVNNWHRRVESLGVKIPALTGNPRTNAVHLMNAAALAAEGREYVPYEETRDLKRHADQAEARAARLAEAAGKAEEALKEARRLHYYCEDTWYSCPLADEGCADDRQPRDVCNCGASEVNARIDAALLALASARAEGTGTTHDFPNGKK